MNAIFFGCKRAFHGCLRIARPAPQQKIRAHACPLRHAHGPLERQGPRLYPTRPENEARRHRPHRQPHGAVPRGARPRRGSPARRGGPPNALAEAHGKRAFVHSSCDAAHRPKRGCPTRGRLRVDGESTRRREPVSARDGRRRDHSQSFLRRLRRRLQAALLLLEPRRLTTPRASRAALTARSRRHDAQSPQRLDRDSTSTRLRRRERQESGGRNQANDGALDGAFAGVDADKLGRFDRAPSSSMAATNRRLHRRRGPRFSREVVTHVSSASASWSTARRAISGEIPLASASATKASGRFATYLVTLQSRGSTTRTSRVVRFGDDVAPPAAAAALEQRQARSAGDPSPDRPHPRGGRRR